MNKYNKMIFTYIGLGLKNQTRRNIHTKYHKFFIAAKFTFDDRSEESGSPCWGAVSRRGLGGFTRTLVMFSFSMWCWLQGGFPL